MLLCGNLDPASLDDLADYRRCDAVLLQGPKKLLRPLLWDGDEETTARLRVEEG